MNKTGDIDRLPVEILLRVLNNLNSDDIRKCRFICNRWNQVILNSRVFLARTPARSRIFAAADGSILIQLQKFGRNTVYTSKINIFDTELLKQLELHNMEILNIDDTINADAVSAVFSCLSECIRNYRQQRKLCAVKFLSMKLSEKTQPYFLPLLESLAHKDLTVENCNFTKGIFTTILKQLNTLTHFKWINCSVDEDISCVDQIILQLAEATKREICQRHNSFTIEARHIDPKTICSFLEVWLNARSAPFFTFSIQQCLDDWKLIFMDECNRRKLPQCFFEFPSKKNQLSHVKVRFINGSNSCEMCPVFDVPARSAGQLICYSRYFRDF